MALSPSFAAELVSDALRTAIERRRSVGKQLLYHSDGGCQYTSEAYQHILKTVGISCSMSRTDNCWDNAVVERFFDSSGARPDSDYIEVVVRVRGVYRR